jgi:hypothetical protein
MYHLIQRPAKRMEWSLPAVNSINSLSNFLLNYLSFLKDTLAKVCRLCFEVKPPEAFGYYLLTLINLGAGPIVMSAKRWHGCHHSNQGGKIQCQ